jgi:hypothetical protein
MKLLPQCDSPLCPIRGTSPLRRDTSVWVHPISHRFGEATRETDQVLLHRACFESPETEGLYELAE